MGDDALMYGMPHLFGFYAIVLALLLGEHLLRRKEGLSPLEDETAAKVGVAIAWIRGLVIVFAIPLLHPSTVFIFSLLLSFNLPGAFGILIYLKWLVFSLWILLVLVKVFLEWNYATTKRAFITLVFAVPSIALMYSIYTFMF